MAEGNLKLAQGAGGFTFSLRWLLLSAAAVLMLTGPGPAGPGTVALLVLAGLSNFGLMLYEVADPGQDRLIGLALALDFALGLSLYASAGASSVRLIWIGLLPGFTAALHFKWRATLGVTTAFLVLQAALALLQNPPGLSQLLPLAGAAAVILGAVFVAGQLHWRSEDRVRQQSLADRQYIQNLRQHVRAIFEMVDLGRATLDYKEVLEAALNFGALRADGAQPSASSLTSVALFFQEDQLRVSSSRRLTTADLRVVCPGQTGILGDVIRSGEAAVTADPAHDPELGQFASFQACHSLMALPLRAGFEIYGVIVYGHERANFFDDDLRAMLAAGVNQAIIGLQNAQLFRNLRQEKARLLDAQEQIQKKLARDLHDGPAQDVAALAMRLHFARELLERDVPAASQALVKAEDLARGTSKQLRHLLFTLRPLVLESNGLSAALQQLAQKTQETHGQNMIVEADPGVDDHLEQHQQTALFYIVEEAVNNARKHAQADHVWVRLKLHGDVLAIEVQDDGVGFNVGAVNASYSRRGSLGLVNMRERAEMINGVVQIDSANGAGTRVMVFVPLAEAGQAQAVSSPAPIGAAVGAMPVEPAAAVRTAPAVSVRPEAVQQVETKRHPREMRPPPARQPTTRRGERLPVGLRWAAASAMVATVLLAGAGTAAASGQSVPGDLLYGVKRAGESAQVFVSPASARSLIYAGLARQRLVEITVISQRGNADAVILNGLANDFVTDTASALAYVDDTPPEQQADVLSTLVSVTNADQGSLAALKASAPPWAQAGLDRAVQAASQASAIARERLELVLAAHGGANPATPTPTGETEVPPGQTRMPPGQTRVPPGQTNVPPGQTRVPPVQTNGPPGQTHVPPGQTKVPPGQTEVPPGQTKVPPGQTEVPPGQTHLPPDSTHGPTKPTHEPSGQDSILSTRA